MRLCIIMAEFPALPIWTDAYMLDCGHLSDVEHGRYFLLLMLIWRSPQCRIPNEVEWIARKMRRNVGACETEVMPLIKEFCTTDGNYVYQKRLLHEFNYLHKQSKLQSARIKSRWTKEKGTYRNDTAPVPKRYRTDTPTPTPIIEGEKVLKKEGKANGEVYVKHGTDAWYAWDKHLRATTGKGARHDKRFGWWFPSEFPSEGATQ